MCVLCRNMCAIPVYIHVLVLRATMQIKGSYSHTILPLFGYAKDVVRKLETHQLLCTNEAGLDLQTLPRPGQWHDFGYK